VVASTLLGGLTGIFAFVTPAAFEEGSIEPSN
jgi:hypothetical protein